METLAHVASAFDAAAYDYDAGFGTNRVGLWMRRIVWDYYLKYLRPGSRVLELNCGTGTDAVFLAQRGIRVLATDVSPQMVFHVEEKAARKKLSAFIETKVLAIEALSELKAERFDGIISNFGGINCVADLPKMARDCHACLNERGVFMGALMSQTCLWELAAGTLRANWKHAFRRMAKGGTYANIGGQSVRTFYHPPRVFCRSMAGHFEWKETAGLAIFIPPPYLDKYYHPERSVWRAIGKIDRKIERLYPFRNLGDHYLIALVKRS